MAQVVVEMAHGLRRIERKLYSLADSNKKIETKLESITVQMSRQGQSQGVVKWTVSLPLQEHEQVVQLESQLKENPSVRQEVIAQCQLLTERSVTALAAKVVRRILTTTLASSYCWINDPEDSRFAFSEFGAIILVMADIAQSKFPGVTSTLLNRQVKKGIRICLKNIRHNSRDESEGDSDDDMNDKTDDKKDDKNDDGEEKKQDEKRNESDDDSDASTGTVKVTKSFENTTPIADEHE